MQPSQEKITQLKNEFPDRPLFVVDALIPAKASGADTDEEVWSFVMTAPLREEYKLYTNRMLAASDIKDSSEQLWEMRMIAENAALAQIRWPEREECKKAFAARPEMVDNFHRELRKAAGSLIEFRSRKL